MIGISTVIGYLLFSIKVVVGLYFFELLAIRPVQFYFNKKRYSRQGVPFLSPCTPLFGSLPYMIQHFKDPEYDKGQLIILQMILDQFGRSATKAPPPVIGAMLLQEASLTIASPELAQECYVTHNKIFDKDPMMKYIVEPLMGDSTLFEASSEVQQQKRKALSAAFYKHKLTQMLEIVKVIVNEKMKEWEEQYCQQQRPMDAMAEIEDIHLRIIMGCAFGLESQSFAIKQWRQGKLVEMPLGKAAKDVFVVVFEKIFRWDFVISPFTFMLNYRAKDREAVKNVKLIREFAQGLVRARKEKMADPNYKEQSPDLLSILLTDEYYKDNEKMIIDECITFFVAGAHTVKSVNVNLLIYLTLNTFGAKDKLMREIYEKLFVPYAQQHQGKVEYELTKILEEEAVLDLNYFSMCFNEALRIEPPIATSGTFLFHEDVNLGNCRIKKGQTMSIFFYLIHRNPLEWKQPDEFIPERFDPSSDFYLTPGGKKRHPYSFIPFHGGKRICLGKTFAETIAKFVIPAVFGKFEFEFVERAKWEKGQKPYIQADELWDPEVMVRVALNDKYKQHFL